MRHALPEVAFALRMTSQFETARALSEERMRMLAGGPQRHLPRRRRVRSLQGVQRHRALCIGGTLRTQQWNQAGLGGAGNRRLGKHCDVERRAHSLAR